jgi:hypothetical protein
MLLDAKIILFHDCNMKNVPDLIEAFGGTTVLAKLLETPVGTIGAWKHRKSIPPEMFPRIVTLAKTKRLKGVSFESLYAMREESA